MTKTARRAIRLISIFALSVLAIRSAELGGTAEDNPNQKFIKLVNIASGKVLSVDPNDNAEMSMLITADDTDELRQWTLVNDGEFIKIVNRKSGQLLDVQLDSKEEGA